MTARHKKHAALDAATLRFWWEWIFSLGFAASAAPDDRAHRTRCCLQALGPALPWVILPAVLVWSEIYQLGFWGMLAMLELQSLVVAAAVTAFAPRRTPGLFRDVAVNAFAAMLLAFLAVLLISFVFGLIVLIIVEGE